jgi:hypothetical protein
MRRNTVMQRGVKQITDNEQRPGSKWSLAIFQLGTGQYMVMGGCLIICAPFEFVF